MTVEIVNGGSGGGGIKFSDPSDPLLIGQSDGMGSARLAVEPDNPPHVPALMFLLACNEQQRAALPYAESLCNAPYESVCDHVLPFRWLGTLSLADVPYGRRSFYVLWCLEPFSDLTRRPSAGSSVSGDIIKVRYRLSARQPDNSMLLAGETPLPVTHALLAGLWFSLALAMAVNIVLHRQQMAALHCLLLIFPLLKVGASMLRVLLLMSRGTTGIEPALAPVLDAALTTAEDAVPCSILLVLAKGWPLLHRRLEGGVATFGLVVGFAVSHFSSVVPSSALVVLSLRSVALIVLFAAMLSIFRGLNSSISALAQWVPRTRRVRRSEAIAADATVPESPATSETSDDEDAFDTAKDAASSTGLRSRRSAAAGGARRRRRRLLGRTRLGPASDSPDASALVEVKSTNSSDLSENNADDCSFDNGSAGSNVSDSGGSESRNTDSDISSNSSSSSIGSSSSSSNSSSSSSVEFVEEDVGAMDSHRYLQSLYFSFRHTLFVFSVCLLLLFLLNVVLFSQWLSVALEEVLQWTSFAYLWYSFRLVSPEIYVFRLPLSDNSFNQSSNASGHVHDIELLEFERARAQQLLTLNRRNRRLINRLNGTRSVSSNSNSSGRSSASSSEESGAD